jgi:hypothetical protein
MEGETTLEPCHSLSRPSDSAKPTSVGAGWTSALMLSFNMVERYINEARNGREIVK